MHSRALGSGKRVKYSYVQNKLASLGAETLPTHPLTHLLTGVKCRATSVAKKNYFFLALLVKGGVSNENIFKNLFAMVVEGHCTREVVLNMENMSLYKNRTQRRFY